MIGESPIEYRTLIDNENQIKRFITKVEQVAREYAKYVDNYDLPPIEIDGNDYDDGYHGTYNKETDSFTWVSKKDYLESLRYIDGHLKEVYKVIINDKEYEVREDYRDKFVYSFAGSVTYSQATQQYHIQDFEHLLILLGYPVTEMNGGGTVEWKVGNDTYTVRKLKGWSLQKNGGENLLKYNGNECGGISQSDFEKISNTTVYMDKEQEALIVKSASK